MSSMRTGILEASIRTAMTRGVEGWSVQRVATEAGCAKALVIHHFGSRAALLAETGRAIGEARLERRLAALDAEGTAAIDQLWRAIMEDERTGRSRAAFSLASQGYPVSQIGQRSRLHERAARALGVDPNDLADPTALAALLDGAELQLVAGVPPDSVRAAFDRLWAALIGA